jgi:hypothetical protein
MSILESTTSMSPQLHMTPLGYTTRRPARPLSTATAPRGSKSRSPDRSPRFAPKSPPANIPRRSRRKPPRHRQVRFLIHRHVSRPSTSRPQARPQPTTEDISMLRSITTRSRSSHPTPSCLPSAGTSIRFSMAGFKPWQPSTGIVSN